MPNQCVERVRTGCREAWLAGLAVRGGYLLDLGDLFKELPERPAGIPLARAGEDEGPPRDGEKPGEWLAPEGTMAEMAACR
jgi:hypothetical protein